MCIDDSTADNHGDETMVMVRVMVKITEIVMIMVYQGSRMQMQLGAGQEATTIAQTITVK